MRLRKIAHAQWHGWELLGTARYLILHRTFSRFSSTAVTWNDNTPECRRGLEADVVQCIHTHTRVFSRTSSRGDTPATRHAAVL